jgi:hypothetical protein
MTEFRFGLKDGSALGRNGWMIAKGLAVYGEGSDVIVKVINTRGRSPNFALEIPLDEVDTFINLLRLEKEAALVRRHREARPHDPPTLPDGTQV